MWTFFTVRCHNISMPGFFGSLGAGLIVLAIANLVVFAAVCTRIYVLFSGARCARRDLSFALPSGLDRNDFALHRVRLAFLAIATKC